jgi:hypothetical protein
MAKPRYLVLVKPWDDHPAEVRIYGPWYKYEAAGAFCESVRRAVNAAEEADPGEPLGFAWVIQLSAPRKREARRYAVNGD